MLLRIFSWPWRTKFRSRLAAIVSLFVMTAVYILMLGSLSVGYFSEIELSRWAMQKPPRKLEVNRHNSSMETLLTILNSEAFKYDSNVELVIEAAQLAKENPSVLNAKLGYESNVEKNSKLTVEKLTGREIELLEMTLKDTILKTHRSKNTTGMYNHDKPRHLKRLPAWQQFQNGISQDEFYQESNSSTLSILMHDLRTQKILKAYERVDGTQLKLVLEFADGSLGMFKPKRFKREDSEIWPNHYQFSDYERHFAEIATFHLDRLLGFRRVPPAVGRFLNLRDLEHVCDEHLQRTFFLSPIGNLCFTGNCDTHCDYTNAVCGTPYLLEGSISAFLPLDDQRAGMRNPWRRSYNPRHRAKFEKDPNYCENVKETPPFNQGRLFLDVIDMGVLDYLTGNWDRHHLEVFEGYNNDTYALHLDNGRAFGKSNYDDILLLSPLTQCCMIRKSTLARILELYVGPEPLSSLMRSSMETDLASPILLDNHLNALDRRIPLILKEVLECLRTKKRYTVVFDDGF